MISSAGSRPRLGRAALGSAVVHALLALCIPPLVWTASTATPVETISFVRTDRLEIVRVPRPQAQPRALAPHRSLTPRVTLVTEHVELSRAVPRRKASPLPAVSSAISSAPALARQSILGHGKIAAPPAPAATPVPRQVASVPNRIAGGYLPFGAEQPEPVLDPQVLRTLAALGVHVTLVVVVGDDGHTKDISFDPPLDGATQAHIESLLADATWDPAVCGGGIACEGRATIKL